MPTTQRMSAPDGVKVLHKASQLLDCFTQDEPDLSLTALAARCGLHPATAARILATLEQIGLVAREEKTRTYSLGIKAFELGNRVRYRTELARVAQPHMQRLVDDYDESVYLGTFHNGFVVYLAVLQSTNPIRLHIYTGDRVPAHSTGSGQVLLAFQKPGEPQRGLSAAVPPDMWEHLNLVREQGYNASIGLPHPEIASVAAPVWGREGQIAAAVSLCGPVHRLPLARLHELAPRVMAVASAISHELGFTPPSARGLHR